MSYVTFVDLLLWYHVTSGVELIDFLLWYHVTSGISLVQQELPILPDKMRSLHGLRWVRVTRSFVLYACIVYRCLSFLSVFCWPLRFLSHFDSVDSFVIFKRFFLFKFIVTMASGSIPADFIYSLSVIPMQFVQEGIVDLLVGYHDASGVTFVDLFVWYHACYVRGTPCRLATVVSCYVRHSPCRLAMRYSVTSGVSLVNLLLWYNDTLRVVLVEFLLRYLATSGVAPFRLAIVTSSYVRLVAEVSCYVSRNLC